MQKKFTIVLAIAAFCIVRVNPVNAQINAQDSLALVALYNSTNGANWNNNNNWLTAAPVSTWHGITVNDVRVSQIDLTANNLKGSLPIELGNLDSLINLTLEFNNLSGSIPAQLGNIKALACLCLDYNNFSGYIPVELGNITQLNYLYLNNNNLKGKIPAELGNLLNLQVLDLSYNNLSGRIPGTLGNLQNLFNLELRFNKLTGSIPSSFSKLTKLNGLDLNSNKLSGTILSKLGTLPFLFRLSLDHNQFTGAIPSSLSKLPNLLFLFLNNNQLSGSIPTSFGNLSLLTDLDLSYNQLSNTIPSSLAKLKNLSYLRLDSNKFTFAGMGKIASTFSFAQYAPQATIPLNINGNLLSVSAGGTLSANTYNWYKDGSLYLTRKGDSTLAITDNGTYSVNVTNTSAPALTLYSDSVIYSAALNAIASRINNKISIASVYPNPAKTNTTLVFNADGKYTISITDVSGKILQTKTGVANKNGNTVQLNVSKYVSGVYFISIVDEKSNKQTLLLNKE